MSADAPRRRLATLKPKVKTLGAVSTGGWNNPTRGTRHERGYGTEWDHTRLRILKRDCYCCQMCMRQGFVTAGNIVDHITPKAEGGTDDEANLETICKPHHTEKTQAESNRFRIA